MRKKRKLLRSLISFVLAIALMVSGISLDSLFAGKTDSNIAEAAEKVSTPSDWQELMIALSNAEVTEVILQDDIDLETDAWSKTPSHASSTLDNYIFTVNGTKTLDLNGHSININSRRDTNLYHLAAKYPEQTMFKIVGSLTINDTSGKNSRIRFNSKVWYASKSPGFQGEYYYVDYRNVFEIMDGGTLILNAGDIQAGRSETQWMYGALDNYDIGDSMSGQWFNRYHGNATTVIPGNGVIVNPGATFIMNGGSITARAQSKYTKQACIWLKAKDVYNEAPDYSSFNGKTTTIHINDGCLNGDAGASILNHAFPAYASKVDLRITSGCFDLGKEDKVRQTDNNGSTYYGLSEVIDGWYGESNIPINSIVGYRDKNDELSERVDLRVTHNRTKFTSIADAVSRGWLVEKSYTTGKGDSAVKTSLGYFFADNDVKTGPKAESEDGILRAAYNGNLTHEAKVCDDAHIVWYYVDNYWNLDDNPLDLTWSNDAHHAEQFIWHVSDGTDTISIVEDCAEISVEKIKEELSHNPTMYNRVMSKKSVLYVTCDYGEVYNGYYNYVIKVSTPGSGYKLQFFSYDTTEGANHDWQKTKVIKAANCTEDGSHEETCSLCGTKKTVVDAKLGHDYEEGAFAVYENWSEGGYNGTMASTVSYMTYHREKHCKRCGLYLGKAKHNFEEITVGTATCSVPKTVTKKCKDCGFVYSVTKVYEPHEAQDIFAHSGYSVDGGGHWHTCKNCGQIFDYSKHYDNNGNGLCDVCGNGIATLQINTIDGEPVNHASTLTLDGYVSNPNAENPIYDLKEDWESWFDPETEFGNRFLGYLHTLYVGDTNDTSVISAPSGTKYTFALRTVNSITEIHKNQLNKYDPSGTLAKEYDNLVSRMMKDFYSYVDTTMVDGKLVFSVKKETNSWVNGSQIKVPYGIMVDYQWRYVLKPSYNRLNLSLYPYKYANDGVYGRSKTMNLGTIQGVLDVYPDSNKPAFDPEKPYYVELVAKVKFITRVSSVYAGEDDYNKEVAVELTSDTVEAPALTKVAETAANCTTPTIHEHYEGDGKYFSYWSNKNSGDGIFTEVINGNTVQVLTEVSLEELYMGKALGHSYSYGCDQTCNREGCGFVDETRVHEKASGAKLEPCLTISNKHGYKCKYCNEVCVDLDFHNYDLVADVPADCGHDGSGHYECTLCGDKLAGTHTIPKGIYQHDFVLDESRTVPVGCENDGTYVFVCSICGTEETETKTKTGHNIVHRDASLPTCVKDGTVDCYECLNCGKRWKNSELTQVLTEGVFPASEEYHDYCLECNNGCVSWTACKYCGKILEGSRKELHSHTHEPAKAPTSGKKGNIEHWWCNETGTTLYYGDAEITQSLTEDEVFIPALGAYTITFADVNAKTVSVSNAVITGVTDGQKASGELTFKVQCDKACIVLVSADGGETYTRIEAVKTTAPNTGSFTIDVQSDILLVVARLGDVSLDGKVDSADALQILRFDVNKAKFDAAQKLIADVSYDGKIDSADALQILRFDVNKAKLKWNKDDTI